MLKARYFPRATFFQADVGDRPSLTWRNILQVRSCLLPRIRRRIGNGILTSIWADHWLPSPSSGTIITRRPEHSTFPERVSDMIDWASWSLNYELVASTFWPVDVHQILQVPFGAPSTEDRLVWDFSKLGNFTVRSCYHNLISGKLCAEPLTTSLPATESSIWNWIWILKVPPKVRTFLWRGCKEILPTQSCSHASTCRDESVL